MNAPPRPFTAHRGNSRRRDTTAFLRAMMHHPHQVGAIAQSGRRLAAQAAALIPDTTDPYLVVEIGPGTGVITDMLQAALPHSGTLVTVELNPVMVDHLRTTRPWLNIISGDAIDLPQHLHNRGLPSADLIVSAVPWTLWNVEQQRRTLAGLADALTADGVLATVVTLSAQPTHAAVRFRQLLRRRFNHVRAQRIVWRNTPPARWYVATAPRAPH
jgi:phosphatidylethanolamine/phosphatidyl-N-methylethanolamine N-methyltransferase